MSDLLSESIYNAQTIKDIALTNAKRALEQAFLPIVDEKKPEERDDMLEKLKKLQSMCEISRKINDFERDAVDYIIEYYMKTKEISSSNMKYCNELYKTCRKENAKQ